MRTRIIISCWVFLSLLLIECRKSEEKKEASVVAPSEPVASERVSHEGPPKEAVNNPLPSSPIISHGDRLSVSQIRQQILDEIDKLIGSPANGLRREHWRIIKKRYWPAAFDEIIQDSQRSVDTSSVKNLLVGAPGKQPIVAQILTGNFTGVADENEQKSLVALHLLAMSIAGSGGASLPAAFMDRQNSTEITRGDLILFEVFNDAFVDVQRAQLSEADLAYWKQLANSSNGLYRLLALRTFRRVAPDPVEWIDFYRSYVNEADPGILEEVADLAFQTARPEAATLINDIRVKVGDTTNSVFLSKLDRSIEWLRKLPQQ